MFVLQHPLQKLGKRPSLRRFSAQAALQKAVIESQAVAGGHWPFKQGVWGECASVDVLEGRDHHVVGFAAERGLRPRPHLPH